MSWISKIFDVARYAAFLSIMVMVVVTLADIFLRQFDQSVFGAMTNALPPSVPGVVDLVEAMVIMAAFMAIPVVFLDQKHIGVEVVTDMLNTKVQKVLSALAVVLSGAFMVVCTLTGWGKIWSQKSVGYTSPTIGIPIWWFWVAITIGSALSVLACGIVLVRLASKSNRGN